MALVPRRGLEPSLVFEISLLISIDYVAAKFLRSMEAPQFALKNASTASVFTVSARNTAAYGMSQPSLTMSD